MSEIEFIYQEAKINIQSKSNEKIKEFIKKYTTKLGKNKEDLYFVYGGGILNENLTFETQANEDDKKINKMIVFVNNKSENNDDGEISMKKSKYIICPQCKESSRILIDNYNLGLYDFKNGYKTDNISINKFEQTQNYDESKIECEICYKVNKTTSYQKFFYICLDCKKNLCPLCKSKHDKDHNVIDYDDRLFTCDFHYESYYSYCENCKKDLCIACEKEHNGHKIIYYGAILPEVKKLKDELKNFNDKKEQFKNEVNNIIKMLTNLIDKTDKYYEIYNDIINSCGNKKQRNYSLLKNIEDINKFKNIFIQDINEIINEKNIDDKMNNMINFYNKMSSSYEKKPEKFIPKNIEFKEISSNCFKIFWEIDDMKLFNVELRKENSNEKFTKVYEGNSNNCLIENLNRNTNYEIRICSIFNNKISPWSNIEKVKTDYIKESIILNDEDKNKLFSWLNPLFNGNSFYLKLIYRRGYDMSFETFHKKCNNKGQTVLICKLREQKIGGYTNINWESLDNKPLFNDGPFIFSFNKNMKYNYNNRNNHSVYLDKNHGPDFNWDLTFNKENQMKVCVCAPVANGYAYSNEPLIGDGLEKEIEVDEVEVFQIKFIN